MSLIKLNDRAVKDVTQFGSISSLGSLTHISTATASASASIEFTSGIDSTYKEYIFYFVNIHPQTDDKRLEFQADTGTNTNYNQTITSTVFRAFNDENDSGSGLGYRTDRDQAQGTNFQQFQNEAIGNANDECLSGYLHIFNPSSTTFVKHFLARISNYGGVGATDQYLAGYFNTTSALTRFKFRIESGNIDSGQILLFGVN